VKKQTEKSYKEIAEKSEQVSSDMGLMEKLLKQKVAQFVDC